MVTCRHLTLAALLTFFSALAPACAEEGTKTEVPPGTTDAGETPPADASETPPADAGDGTCTNLADVGETVTFVVEATAPPAPTGGTIADGTYVLTSGKVFTGPGGESGQSDQRSMTARVTGNVIEAVKTEAPLGTEDAVKYTFFASGAVMHLAEVCPGARPVDLGYSATATSLTLHIGDDDGMRVYGFEKR